MLYLIGLGLGSEEDITVRGLEAVKTCQRVYLEAYTSILMNADIKTLETFYGKSIIIADRELVEQGSDDILASADVEDVAFLVVGDPFGATTHTDLVLRARELCVPVEVIHNASVMNAVGACGLQLYNFGQTISLVFFTDTWKPDSFYDKIKENRMIGLHTLVLFDIKVKEQSMENLARGRKIFEPPRYMDVPTACKQLLEIEDKRQEMAYTAETPCVSISRLGSTTQKMVAAPLYQLADLTSEEFGPPLHSLVILGSKRTHDLEIEFMEPFAYPDADAFRVAIERDRLVPPIDAKPKPPVDDDQSD